MKDTSLKISVIIPVYNVEKYLRICLESILNQNFKGYEIILINDGSTDNSLNICREYEKKYSNIIVINEENSGPSAARNKGLEYAKGKYISFIDSDDELLPNYFKILYDTAEKNKCDVLTCGYNTGKNTADIKPNFIFNKIMSGREFILSNKKIHSNNDLCFPWRYFYKRSIIKDGKVKFNTNITIGEDTVFSLEAILKSKRVMAIEDILYSHRIDNPNSLMTVKYKPKLEESLINQYDKRLQLSEEYGLMSNKDYCKNMANYYINNIYTMMVNNILNSNSRDKRTDIKRILNYKMFKDSFKVLGIGYKANSLKEYIYYLAIRFKIYIIINHVMGI